MKGQWSTNDRYVRSMLGNGIALKVIAIGVLSLLLMIPATMIESLIKEREARQKEVLREIGSKFGREQTILGPVISVPYKSASNSVSYIHFLPDTLHVSGQVDPVVRYRGIFEAVLYDARIVLTGSFSLPKTDKLNIYESNIVWSEAAISLGISDMRGIREPIVAHVNDGRIPMNPGLVTKDLMSSGVSAGIVFDPQTENYTFRLVLKLTGSQRVNFVPVGKTTTASLQSVWPDPSFSGAFLPVARELSKTGFSAKWSVLDFNRDYPQYWRGNTFAPQLNVSSFGVGLFTPVDFYQKSMRTTKYSVLFVVLTFLAFFISELVTYVRLHPMQYLLIGLAIVTFYSLLISLSEHIKFATAYAISSSAIAVLVAAYAKSILKSTKSAIIMGSVLAIVYVYSYWLLQMVDYALVVGSVGLFFVLSIVMYVTRNLDWYSISVGSTSASQSNKLERQGDESSSELPTDALNESN